MIKDNRWVIAFAFLSIITILVRTYYPDLLLIRFIFFGLAIFIIVSKMIGANKDYVLSDRLRLNIKSNNIFIFDYYFPVRFSLFHYIFSLKHLLPQK